jgi:outer membrane protein OmpA-like peptidoglycan-associated protein
MTGQDISQDSEDHVPRLNSRTALATLAIAWSSAALPIPVMAASQALASGTTPSIRLAQTIVEPGTDAGSIVVLESNEDEPAEPADSDGEPARLEPIDPPADTAERVVTAEASYEFTAVKAADGAISFTGALPSVQAQQFLAARAPGSADETEVRTGAPEDFVTLLLSGTEALGLLDEGALKFDGDTWTLSGQGNTAAIAAATSVAGASIALDLIESIPEPVEATPYAWAASKDADGVTVSGAVPTEQAQRFVAVRAGSDLVDQSTVSEGAPESFIADLLVASEILTLLEQGDIAYDGETWTIAGVLAGGATIDSVTGLVGGAGTAASQWSIDVIEAAPEPAPEVVEAAPPAPVETPMPEVSVEPEPEPAPTPSTDETAAAPPSEPDSMSEDTAASAGEGYEFSAVRSDGATVLSGYLPSDAARRYFAVLADGEADAVEIRPDTPETFLATLDPGLRALGLLDDGTLAYSEGTWTLSGEAASTEALAEAEALVAAADTLTAQIDGPDMAAQCQARLGAFSEENAILFQSGSAAITPSSSAAITALAGILRTCPDVPIYVEGHTDSDGDERANLVLSVARAEAVVDALVQEGVISSRLYAAGFGEAAPVATNDTPQGRAENRRIVIGMELSTHDD